MNVFQRSIQKLEMARLRREIRYFKKMIVLNEDIIGYYKQQSKLNGGKQ